MILHLLRPSKHRGMKHSHMPKTTLNFLCKTSCPGGPRYSTVMELVLETHILYGLWDLTPYWYYISGFSGFAGL